LELLPQRDLIDEDMPQEFWKGVAEFQQGNFYACHDTLEALWIEAQEPNKTFFQGILQIAVACYHLGNRNWRGAVILLGEGRRRLISYQPEYGGIDVELLIGTSTEFLSYLQSIGAERVSEVSDLVQRSSTLEDRRSAVPPIPCLREWKR
jgi:uncharacterized protein